MTEGVIVLKTMKLFLVSIASFVISSSFFALPINAEEGTLDVTGSPSTEVGGAIVELGSIYGGEATLNITNLTSSFPIDGQVEPASLLNPNSLSITTSPPNIAPAETNLYLDSSIINLPSPPSTIEISLSTGSFPSEQIPTFEIDYPSLGINPNPGYINLPPLTIYPGPHPSDNFLVASAKWDLVKRLGIAYGDISLTSMVKIDWSDTSLGCPQEGMYYAQVITPGYLITLEVEGKFYSYHADYHQVVFCPETETPSENDDPIDSDEDEDEDDDQDGNSDDSDGDGNSNPEQPNNSGSDNDPGDNGNNDDCVNDNGDNNGGGENDENEEENEDEGDSYGSENEDEQDDSEENPEATPETLVEEDETPQPAVLAGGTLLFEASSGKVFPPGNRKQAWNPLEEILDFFSSIFRSLKRNLTAFGPMSA